MAKNGKDLTKLTLKELLPEYYSKNVLIRNLFFMRLKKSIEISELKDNSKILDLGTGSGELVRLLLGKKTDIDIYAFDINPSIKNIKLKNATLNATFIVGDARNLPFKRNMFDIVFCLDVLEHINDVDKVLVNIKNILKPNGLLIVSSPTESYVYKLCRFIAKGKISEKSGPASPHYYNAKILNNKIKKVLTFEKEIFLPTRLLKLFVLSRYRKITRV